MGLIVRLCCTAVRNVRNAFQSPIVLLAVFLQMFQTASAWADTLYVTEYNSGRVTAIAANGTKSVFTTSGLDSPYGIAVDKTGNVYVNNHLSGEYRREILVNGGRLGSHCHRSA